MRTLLIAASALSLGACNMVYSEKPLLTAADAKDAAVLRPGVWVRPEAECALTPGQTPLPDCANALTVSAEAFLPPPGVTPPPGEVAALPYLVSGRDPAVVQVEYHPPKEAPPRWLFLGLKPSSTDAAGRVTEARIWFVQCGPPPPKGGARYVTLNPLPGLTIKENDCIAADADAVRGAATASEAWDQDKNVIRWLREK
jgi:hypothetical protein